MTNLRIPSSIPLPDGRYANDVSMRPQGAPQQSAPIAMASRPGA